MWRKYQIYSACEYDSIRAIDISLGLTFLGNPINFVSRMMAINSDSSEEATVSWSAAIEYMSNEAEIDNYWTAKLQRLVSIAGGYLLSVAPDGSIRGKRRRKLLRFGRRKRIKQPRTISYDIFQAGRVISEILRRRGGNIVCVCATVTPAPDYVTLWLLCGETLWNRVFIRK